MNYQKVYNSIIQNRLENPHHGYTEQHHIVPKSLGGSDDQSNLVKLSAREHFVCHLLLTKIHKHNTSAYYKMVKAFMMMWLCKSNNQQRYINSKKYEKLKEIFSEIQSISQTGQLNSQYGKSRSEETKNKIRQSLLKKYKSSNKHKPDQKNKSNKHKPDQKNKSNKHKPDQKNKAQLRVAKKLEQEKEKENTIDMYRQYYRIYNQYGFEEFVRQTGYNKTKQNLVQRFSTLLEEFKPQNGKRRGCKK